MTETELVIKDLAVQTRQLQASTEEVKELARLIQANGLTNRIVVTDGVVVDGLKRIEALKLLKVQVVPAFVSDDFVELCEYLAKQYDKEYPFNIARALNVIEDLEPARESLILKRRQSAGSARHAAKKRGTLPALSIRKLHSIATGLSESRMEIASMAVRAAAIDPAAKAQLDLVRAGLVTIYGFRNWVEQRRLEEVQVALSPASEVRGVMERGLRAMTNALEQMSKFGSASVLTETERNVLMGNLDKVRRDISGLKKMIDKGIKGEEEIA